MPVPKISVTENSNKNRDFTKESIRYGLSAVISGVLGLSHGIYKKIDWDKFTYSSNEPYIINESDLVKIKLAILKDSGNNDAISISGIKRNADITQAHTANKILLDNKTNIEKMLKQHNSESSFLHYLIKLGFNPSKNKLMEFVTNYGTDELNQKLKTLSGIDFDIELLKNKGRENLEFRTVDIAEIEKGKSIKIDNGLIHIENKEDFHAFKKILNPYDEKVFEFIEKLPFGKKFTDFMKKTNSPIKSIKFKPMSHLYCDKTSMLKGAGVMAIVKRQSV